MDHYPESLETQCYSCFFHSEYGYPRAIFIGLTHDMASGPGTDSFNAAYHGRLIHITKAKPATHATAITPYLIFLHGDILDQVLAMLFLVYLDIYLHRNIILIYADFSG
jgi:hypothetical protein